jgi:ABC-type transport system substrate-binding protein
MTELPPALEPWTNQANQFQYILYQAYSPLIEVDLKGTRTSKFLDLKSSGDDLKTGKTFLLCLKKDTTYCDLSPVKLDDLTYLIRHVHKNQAIFPKLQKLESQGSCLKVTLQEPFSRYLDLLTSMSITPLKSGTYSTPTPMGLGPFCVTEFSQKTIRLIRREPAKPDQFTDIEFFPAPEAKDRSVFIHDSNHLFGPLKAEFSLKDGLALPRATMKSYAIVANILDASLRREFVSCFRTQSLDSLYQLKLSSIPGLLPRGLPGYQEKPRMTDCRPRQKKVKVPWLAFRGENLVELNRILLKQNLPVELVIQQLTPLEAKQWIFGKKEYVAVIGFDSAGFMPKALPEASSFFEAFYLPERIISKPIAALSQVVPAAVRSSDVAQKLDLYAQAHRMVLDSYYIVPLGQYLEPQVYPRFIKNIIWLDEWGGIPDISAMEIIK